MGAVATAASQERFGVEFHSRFAMVWMLRVTAGVADHLVVSNML